MPVFTDILNQGRQNFMRAGFADSRDWFREKAREVSNVNLTRLINSNPAMQRAAVAPGYMYLFSYDPKFKDDLPYYDRYPLVFPFTMHPDGFTGINMHYLPHLLRARLMDALYNLASNQNFDDRTKLRMSYDILNSASRYKYFKPCIKRYLYTQLRTRFLLIPSNEWDIALFLPLERFTVNKASVYRDSNATVRRS
jgi:hypothetical protein